MSLYEIYPTIIPYTVTARNLLADTTTANAFIAPVGVDLGQYRGDMIEIWSGTTLWAQAWISETAPAGIDTTELLVNGDFSGTWSENVPQNWSRTGTITGSSYLVADDVNNRFQVVSDGAVMGVSQNVGTVGSLINYMLNLQTVVLGSARLILGSGSVTAIIKSSAGVLTGYATHNGSDNWIYLVRYAEATNFTANSISALKVNTPASTGALLLSTKGGSRGWQYKHASFNPNVEVTLRILARRIASGQGGYYK
jgi:hypothetical protein